MSETQEAISNVPDAGVIQPFDLSTLNPVDMGQKQVRALDPNEIIVDEDKNGRRYAPSAKGIQELATSIVTSGQLQPVVVQKTNRGYELIFGFRRVRAIMHANEQHMTVEPLKVNAMVVEMNDVEALAANVAENADREALSPIDWAHIIRRFTDQGVTKKDIARLLKKSAAWVTETSQIGELRPAIQKKIHTGDIGYTIARELVQLQEEDQDDILKDLEKPGGGDKRDKIRAKRRAKNQSKGAKGKGGKGDGESNQKIQLTLREVREAFESMASNTKPGKDEDAGDAGYSDAVQKLAGHIIRFMDGKISEKVLAKKIDEA